MRSPRSLFIAFLKWGLAVSALCGVAYGVLHLRERTGDAGKGQFQVTSPVPAEEGGSVELDQEAAERLGIAVEPAREVRWSRPLVVYGRVVPNARATSEVRAAFAGILRAAADAAWPAPGERVFAGQVLGYVDVRVGPEVRTELQNKLTAARLRRRGEAEVVRIHERTVESLQKVTDRQIVSRVELDTAQVNLAEARIQLATAEAEQMLWERAIQDVEHNKTEADSLWRQPITAPGAGEVTELAGENRRVARSGRRVRWPCPAGRPLVRLDLPAEASLTGLVPSEIQLEATASPPPALSGVSSLPGTGDVRSYRPARLVGPAPSVDISTQLAGYWYEVQPAGSAAETAPLEARRQVVWRPGLQVKAELRPAGSSVQPAVAVPVNSVLFHEGRPLVYVRTGDETYERREVRLLGREGDVWIVSPAGGESRVGIVAGEAVVHRQAQVLLSKEFLKGSGDAD